MHYISMYSLSDSGEQFSRWTSSRFNIYSLVFDDQRFSTRLSATSKLHNIQLCSAAEQFIYLTPSYVQQFDQFTNLLFVLEHIQQIFPLYFLYLTTHTLLAPVHVPLSNTKAAFIYSQWEKNVPPQKKLINPHQNINKNQSKINS